MNSFEYAYFSLLSILFTIMCKTSMWLSGIATKTYYKMMDMYEEHYEAKELIKEEL